MGTSASVFGLGSPRMLMNSLIDSASLPICLYMNTRRGFSAFVYISSRPILPSPNGFSEVS